MTSAAQVIANVGNAQKSTGPKTEPGKHRTRLNAYRHGLTGQICIFGAAEQQAFDRHCDGIRDSLEPVGALELDLAQSIAEDRWRLTRARALECGIFALGQCGQPGSEDPGQLQIDSALSQARTWLAEGQNLLLLALYEQRIHRAIEKNTAELRSLQTERRTTRQQALDEALLLAQLAYTKGERYDLSRDFPPEMLKNGSDFSTAGVNRLITRNQRLAEARFYAGKRWETKDPFPKPGFRIPTNA
jgi:hypothetical protein